MRSMRILILTLAFSLAAAAAAQERDPTLAKLVQESAKLKQIEKDLHSDASGFLPALHAWIESRLPADRAALDADSLGLQWRMRQQLAAADVRGVTRLDIRHPSETPDALIVTTEGGLLRNSLSTALYRFTEHSRVKVLEAAGEHIQISSTDERGNQLVLVTRDQNRARLGYRLYRLSANGKAQPILSGHPLADLDEESVLPSFDLRPKSNHRILRDHFRRQDAVADARSSLSCWRRWR
jgi:hypothetical protein